MQELTAKWLMLRQINVSPSDIGRRQKSGCVSPILSISDAMHKSVSLTQMRKLVSASIENGSSNECRTSLLCYYSAKLSLKFIAHDDRKWLIASRVMDTWSIIPNSMAQISSALRMSDDIRRQSFTPHFVATSTSCSHLRRTRALWLHQWTHFASIGNRYMKPYSSRRLVRASSSAV